MLTLAVADAYESDRSEHEHERQRPSPTLPMTPMACGDSTGVGGAERSGTGALFVPFSPVGLDYTVAEHSLNTQAGRRTAEW